MFHTRIRFEMAKLHKKSGIGKDKNGNCTERNKNHHFLSYGRCVLHKNNGILKKNICRETSVFLFVFRIFSKKSTWL